MIFIHNNNPIGLVTSPLQTKPDKEAPSQTGKPLPFSSIFCFYHTFLAFHRLTIDFLASRVQPTNLSSSAAKPQSPHLLQRWPPSRWQRFRGLHRGHIRGAVVGLLHRSRDTWMCISLSKLLINLYIYTYMYTVENWKCRSWRGVTIYVYIYVYVYMYICIHIHNMKVYIYILYMIIYVLYVYMYTYT